MLALVWLACAKPPPPGAALPAGPECAVGVPCAYDAGLLSLASAFAAKEACSCVFVAGRDEDACAAWVKVSPAVATWRVDRARSRVVAHALGAAETVAVYDPSRGCVLDQR
jgi:hypothetical protein